MGEVIRKSAAVGDIFSDTRTTYTRSMNREGTPFYEAAQAHLAPVLHLIDRIEGDLKSANEVYEDLLAALDVVDGKADGVLGLQGDLIWNAIGRRRSDAAFAVLFPNGITGYTEVNPLEQPMWMELLATLLQAGIHPKLPKETAEAAAAEISAAAVELEAAAEAARKAGIRVKLLEKILQALARVAAMELASMKRALLAKGLTEAEIHEVIPDRPQARKKGPGPVG